ncbi:hypothetical protein [uncultured Methanobrevibacter sp.]|uniref:hypothetical protein n=1 Tax=uncultured Methanobrevibacter sp. TaxID=253161 RepID=UPI0026DF3D89|nr:hypothetical protein [uncultured Methanobrevibacter sp.]
MDKNHVDICSFRSSSYTYSSNVLDNIGDVLIKSILGKRKQSHLKIATEIINL